MRQGWWMNTFGAWLAASRDQDKFWREWHRARRMKKLAYWERIKDDHLTRAYSAARMVTYYSKLLDGDNDAV